MQACSFNEFEDRSVSLPLGTIHEGEENDPVCPNKHLWDVLSFFLTISEDMYDMQSQVLMETKSRLRLPASDFVPGQILLCIDLFQKIKKLSSILRK